jgi:hypothetical protein
MLKLLCLVGKQCIFGADAVQIAAMQRAVDRPALGTFPISGTPFLQFDLPRLCRISSLEEGYGGGTEIKKTIKAQLLNQSGIISLKNCVLIH